MKIIIAIDSFKGSLSSISAAKAVASCALEVYPDSEVITLPVADGGEGTAFALTEGLGGRMESLSVTGPLGEKVKAKYGMIGKTAVIEMSEAAGITLITPHKRDPMITTTFGVGEMILDAIGKGCRDFIIGIGGSATNDGGAGMLEALGFELLDGNGEPVRRGAIGLKDIKTISDSKVSPLLRQSSFRVACDVTNPLLGELGCSRIYGPQKGADEKTVSLMDEYMKNYAEAAKRYNEKADEDLPGAGAAGGMGFAFSSFLGASLVSGIDLILDMIGLEDKLSGADLVITGEGRLDSQTVMGKVPIGVAKAAKKHGIPVIAFSGCIGDGAEICNSHGIDAFFPILRKICTIEEAMDEETAYNNLKNTARQVFLLRNVIK